MKTALVILAASVAVAAAQGPPPLPLPITPSGRVTLTWDYPAEEMGTNLWFLVYRSGKISTAPIAPAVTITNGGFDSWLEGWQASGNVISYDGFASFNAGQTAPGGSISQPLATTAGSAYTLTFRPGILAFNRSEQKLAVTVAGQATSASRTITLTGTASGSPMWGQIETLEFQADGASVVTFHDASTATQDIDLLLDDVKIGDHGAPAVGMDWQLLSTIVGTNKSATVTVTPGVNFFAVKASNFWGASSFFSEVASTPALPRSDGRLRVERAD